LFKNSLNIDSINAENVLALAKNYNLLDYAPKLKSLITEYFGLTDFSGISKYELHQLVNDTLLSKYKGESTLKSMLVEEFINLDVIAAFEIKVNTSRVDFLTINGDSKSFEIKSELDNLTKLAKQVNDYSEVFEFNYIVIDSKHYDKAIKIVPPEYGIWSFENGKKTILNEAVKNTNLNPALQLKLFSKKELSTYYNVFNSDVKEILLNFNREDINKTFKLMLKKRYSQRWQFVKNNKEEILPIDYQFFFNSNISPNIIYNC
jgi:hypothetical protein